MLPQFFPPRHWTQHSVSGRRHQLVTHGPSSSHQMTPQVPIYTCRNHHMTVTWLSHDSCWQLTSYEHTGKSYNIHDMFADLYAVDMAEPSCNQCPCLIPLHSSRSITSSQQFSDEPLHYNYRWSHDIMWLSHDFQAHRHPQTSLNWSTLIP